MRPVIQFVAFVVFALSVAAQPALLDRARAALDHHDPDTAATLLEQAASRDPQNAEVHYLLGIAYGAQAEKASVFRQASLARKTRDEFERAVALDPNHLDARFSLVQYYVEAPAFLGGGEEKARDQANAIAARNPGYGHRAFAFIDTHEKQYAAAVAELDEALKIDPNDMDALFELGHVAALSGLELQRGEAALERYIAHKPGRDDPPASEANDWLQKIRAREGKQ